jgi:crossover junction endodeoxyribonuclease RuvC
MKKISIGIDPGQKGGIAVIIDGNPETFPYSDEKLISVMRQIEESCYLGGVATCLEKVGAMPKQGVTSTFTFGKSAGFIEGVLQAFGIPYQLITPQVWKKEFSLNSDKAKSVEVCKKLFPGVILRATERCTTDHDGMAEALLMAEYARRKF